MTTPPSWASHSRVNGTFALAIDDGDDTDTLPDYIAASGSVTFDPSVPRVFVSEPRVVLIPQMFTVQLDENGHFEVDLVATDIPGSDPASWTYEVVVRLDGEDDWKFTIAAPAGQTNNLVSLYQGE